MIKSMEPYHITYKGEKNISYVSDNHVSNIHQMRLITNVKTRCADFTYIANPMIYK